MRPKFIAGVLLLASCLLGMILLLSKVVFPQRPSPSETGATAVLDTNKPSEPISAPGGVFTDRRELAKTAFAGTNPGFPGSSSLIATNTTDAEQQKLVRKRVSELNSLAMNDDTASRDEILSEMKNPNKVIRAAALEAAIQFDDRSVIPYLQEAAAQTEDPREKVAILDAIDYINLPSLTEHIAQRKAMGLPNAPRSTNSVSRPRPPRRQTSSVANP